MKNDRFLSKSALHMNNVCYKVSFCEYCQRKNSKAFTGLFICAKMVRGTFPST